MVILKIKYSLSGVPSLQIICCFGVNTESIIYTLDVLLCLYSLYVSPLMYWKKISSLQNLA